MGSIDGLYKSITDIYAYIYFISQEAKNRLVDPDILPQCRLTNNILPFISESQYHCAYQNGTRCIQLLKDGRTPGNMRLVYPQFEGYVKGPAMYVATDDLVVAPFSAISALNLLNRLNTSFKDLKEKVVTIGINECLSILKASLTSTSALTNGLRHLLTEVKEEK